MRIFEAISYHLVLVVAVRGFDGARRDSDVLINSRATR